MGFRSWRWVMRCQFGAFIRLHSAPSTKLFWCYLAFVSQNDPCVFPDNLHYPFHVSRQSLCYINLQ